MIFLHSFLDDLRYILIANKNPTDKIRCITDNNVFRGSSSLRWKKCFILQKYLHNFWLICFLICFCVTLETRICCDAGGKNGIGIILIPPNISHNTLLRWSREVV